MEAVGKEDRKHSPCHSAEIQRVKSLVSLQNSNEMEALAVITQQAWNKVIIRWY